MTRQNQSKNGTPKVYNRSLSLQQRFHDVIPGGAHTYAKGDDQFPESMPVYITHGKGARVWDADGNEFIEWGNGLRSVSLGHAFDPISNAVKAQIELGANFGRPATIELECADEFLSIVDGADMVKFCKNGSDAIEGAIKLARAYTGRDMVAMCASHPFFSVHDWFIGSTPMAGGIPEIAKSLTTKFYYNDLESAQKMFAAHPGKIACVILEAQKLEEPADGYLHKLQALCHANGAIFVLDEMITGFRWHIGGAQKKFNIIPDLSTWGKALGNGFAISAVAGKRDIMKLGGLHHDKERVFLLSTTHGAETHAMAAAIANIQFYKSHHVIDRLYEQGSKLERGIMKASRDLNLEDKVSILGPPCCSVYTTRDHDNQPSQPFRTLFLQETMKRGLLMPSTIVSYSHGDQEVNETVEKVHESLVVYRKALDEGIDKYLEGRSVQPVWRKYNK
ncbi:MAG TPA: glutamate-1-semialdehyde 2,1-aminomutase [Chryseolinea sp.]|nr:glutamate-1-semialdehyde 2,1-aminomutase [Chryseolinea sp.]